MMPRGRPPKPTALKEAEGNRGKRALNTEEPTPFGELPNIPTWLPTKARAWWRANAAKLNRIGLLTECDGDAFALLCLLCHEIATDSKIFHAKNEDDREERILTSPATGAKYLNPRLIARSMALKELRALLSQFGMTPSSRASIRIDKPKQVEADPFDLAMSGKVVDFPTDKAG